MSASLPHRTVTSIRSGAGASSSTTTGGGIGAGGAGATIQPPHTPLRPIQTNFPSPSTLRAEEDLIVIELGARRIRVGFAGDANPKATLAFSPESQRRVGDYRVWNPAYRDAWERRDWCAGYQLWRFDLNAKDADLGLVGDRFERAMREAFTKYLLIDSKPRRALLVLPSSTPTPHLSAILDPIFIRFQTPNVSLLSCATMTTVAAGLRSALVVDIGWADTVVTAVCEYREVRTEKSVRAGKLLVEEMHKLLAAALDKHDAQEHVVSFHDCEEVVKRMAWCKPTKKDAPRRSSDSFEDALETVTEEEEEDDQDSDIDDRDVQTAASHQQQDEGLISIPLPSATPPTTLKIPFDDLAHPVEESFFAPELARCSFDDNELPLPQIVYHTLLMLPIDVRATTMSRLIFTGGCSCIPGLRGRIFDEVNKIISAYGWDGVRGRAYDNMKANKSKPRNWESRVPPEHLHAVEKQRAAASRLEAARAGTGSEPSVEIRPPTQGEEGEIQKEAGVEAAGEPKKPYISPAFREPEQDPVEKMMSQRSGLGPTITAAEWTSATGGSRRQQAAVNGELRAVESMGAWSGASLTAALKVIPIASVDRDVWLTQGGAQGASKASDVDIKAQQRQSLGAGGLIRSAGTATWTLGVWGLL